MDTNLNKMIELVYLFQLYQFYKITSHACYNQPD
jgi:hypothetical protein